MAEQRVTARVGPWTPPPVYNQPRLEPDGDIRTVEHKVLGDATIVQSLGPNAETYTLRGYGYADDIGQLRALRGDEVGLRHPIHSGDVLIHRVSADSTGSFDKDNGNRKWVYEYTVEMTEVE